MGMKVYRVLMKDSYYEDDGASAARWTEDAGAASISISSNKHRFAGGGGTNCRAHWTLVVNQESKLEYYFKCVQYDANTVANWLFGMYIFASSSAGAHYGNSYLIAIEDDGASGVQINIYESAANVLTSRATQGITFVQGTTYEFKVEYDPDTGKIEVYQDGTSKVSWTDSSALSSGSYVALRADGINIDYDRVRCRRPAHNPIVPVIPHVIQRMNEGISTFKFTCLKDSNGECEYETGDGVEMTWGDDTEEFDGVVEDVEVVMERGLCQVSGRDWRAEGARGKGEYSAGSNIVSDVMKDIIDNHFTTLQSGFVDGTTDSAVARTIKAQSAYHTLVKLADEVEYSLWQTYWRKFYIGNTYPSSGYTIDYSSDPVLRARWVKEGQDLINDIKIYYSGGSSVTDTDTGSRDTYGKRSQIIVDPTIPDSAHASSMATNILNRHSSNTKMVDIWVFKYWDLKIGDQVTVTVSHLNLSSVNGVVMEKEFGGPVTGIRFRICLSATPYVRRSSNIHAIVGQIGDMARDSLGYQV